MAVDRGLACMRDTDGTHLHAAVPTAPAPSPAASTSKGGGSTGKAGGLMGWMSSSKKEATSAKQLVGRPDVFGEDDPLGIAGHARSDAGPALHKEEAARGSPSSSASSAAEGLVGVGITFGQFHKDHFHAGALYVKQLQEHGPAMESRMVSRGDILYEVDGVNSYRRSIERIQGPVGSWVSLVLKRPAATGGGEAIEALPAVSITLQRRAPPPGHQLGVVEEPRRSRTHDDGARADGGGRGGGQAGAGRETGENMHASSVHGQSASSKTPGGSSGSGQTVGVLDGCKLHADLLQVPASYALVRDASALLARSPIQPALCLGYMPDALST